MDQPSIKLKIAEPGPQIEDITPPRETMDATPKPDASLVQIGKMFSRLDQNLTAKIQRAGGEDRERIRSEIDALTRAINGLEGVLRIEQPKELKDVVDECFVDFRKRRSRSGLFVAILVSFVIGIACGAAIEPEMISQAGPYLASLFP